MSKKALLMILDGWGIGDHKKDDVIFNTPTPYWDSLLAQYPHSQLQASGENVGLPDGQMGNSEVGHLNIGAGRIVYQDLVKINRACADNSIMQNAEVKAAFSYAKDKGANLHFMGLTSNGGVHSSLEHLFKLCDIAKAYGIENTFIHCFMDGRDTDPKSGKGFIEQLTAHCAQSAGKIASIVGRFYAMDRDKRWERVKEAYDLLIEGKGKQATDMVQAMQESYDEGVTDEFIKPINNATVDGTIKAADGEKKTVYIPYNFTPAVTGGWRSSPAMCEPSVDLELAAKYFNVVTDTVKDPSGTDEEGKAAYVAEDIVRASAEEIAACDMILVGMDAPHVASTAITNEDGTSTYLPPSIQYEEYTATTAKDQSVAGDTIVEQFNDGYTVQTVERVENRSYKGNTAARANEYSHLETLQYCAGAKGDAKVVVLMNQNGSGAMVFGEVEPLADVILNGYKVGDEAFLKIVAGENEPNGLLVAQMPASMEAVEAQTGDDTPRDLECYVDANGNTYDFAFVLNWSGVINDSRVETYSAAPLTEVTSFDFQYAK